MDGDKQDLLKKALREELTVAEKQQWEELLAGDPQLRDGFAEEGELDRLMGLLPDAPISSNFTALTVQAALRKDKTTPKRSFLRWRFLRFATVTAMVMVVAGGLFNYRSQRGKQAEMAASVRSFSGVASVLAENTAPPAEVFQNFESIQRLSLPAEGELDMELLVALQK